jgi:hypothetical protein
VPFTYELARFKNQARLVVITTAPALDSDGVRLSGRFDCLLGNRVLIAGTDEPLLDAARALLKLGFDPDGTVAMRHTGADHDAVSGRIGTAAALTVREDCMRFRRYEEFPPTARQYRRVRAPVRPTSQGAIR